ncbi:MAG TPA: M48 family metalloprotease [Sphingomicrobium sp.]|nr:M48 family metalloprotease [Sphingomicrobium sp.]
MRARYLVATALASAMLAPALSAQAVRTLNQRYVAEAQRQHPQLVAEFGGAETGQRAAYVESVGRRVAAYSGIANSAAAYRFTTLNSAVENAFAVPGGYVYITRQLMVLMDDESQLAFALGHEVGHIAANHAQQRQSAASRNSVLGVLGAILGSVVGNNVFGNVISQGAQQAAQFSTLRFSRQQEYSADDLGIRYLAAAGYDPLGSSGVLSALTRASALEARVQGRDSRQTPEWASTHPLSANRAQQAQSLAQRTGRAGMGMRNRDQFLAQLEGIYVDDDPAQGVIEGRTFTHPDLRIQFAVPPGYLMQNSSDAVSIKGSAGQAQFSGGRFNGTIDQYVYRVIQELTGGQMQLAVPPPQRTVINGIPAAFTTTRANTSSGAVDVSVMAYQWDASTIYHFVMLTRGGVGVGPFIPMVDSIRRISGNEAAAIRPKIIDVVTVRPGDTVHSLAGRMAYRDYQLDRFLSLNGLSAGSRLVPGQKVKLVLFGARRS